jgi:hypothetical protein
MKWFLALLWFVCTVFISLFIAFSKNELVKLYKFDFIFLAIATGLQSILTLLSESTVGNFIRHWRLLILFILFIIFRILTISLSVSNIPNKEDRTEAQLNEIIATGSFTIILFLFVLWTYIPSLRYQIFFLLQVGGSLFIVWQILGVFSHTMICD